jgi:hypothetical protein
VSPGAAVVVPAAAEAHGTEFGAATPLSLNEKLKLLGEMKQLIQERASLASQEGIPPAVRESVMRDINERLEEIEKLLS